MPKPTEATLPQDAPSVSDAHLPRIPLASFTDWRLRLPESMYVTEEEERALGLVWHLLDVTAHPEPGAAADEGAAPDGHAEPRMTVEQFDEMIAGDLALLDEQVEGCDVDPFDHIRAVLIAARKRYREDRRPVGEDGGKALPRAAPRPQPADGDLMTAAVDATFEAVRDGEDWEYFLGRLAVEYDRDGHIWLLGGYVDGATQEEIDADRSFAAVLRAWADRSALPSKGVARGQWIKPDVDSPPPPGFYPAMHNGEPTVMEVCPSDDDGALVGEINVGGFVEWGAHVRARAIDRYWSTPIDMTLPGPPADFDSPPGSFVADGEQVQAGHLILARRLVDAFEKHGHESIDEAARMLASTLPRTVSGDLAEAAVSWLRSVPVLRPGGVGEVYIENDTASGATDESQGAASLLGDFALDAAVGIGWRRDADGRVDYGGTDGADS